MEKIQCKEFDVYISEQALRERECLEKEQRWLLEDRIQREISLVFHMPQIRDYVVLWGNQLEREKFAVLNAHGDFIDGKWMYMDGKNGEVPRSVQTWINANDGEYSCLIFSVCNPRSTTPTAKKSILAVPHSSFKFGESSGKHEAIFDLIVPGIGEINAYTIDYELRKLARERL